MKLNFFLFVNNLKNKFKLRHIDQFKHIQTLVFSKQKLSKDKFIAIY